MMNEQFIYPDWPAPPNIKALSTTRIGGHSLAPYDEFNLGAHVGDDTDAVQKNRKQLIVSQQLPASPYWLNQTHSTHVINSTEWQQDIEADAMISTIHNHICTIMTADCLPILLCNTQGDIIAALHAGWRGLAAGILENTINKFGDEPKNLMVWLGPAIGPTQFEVGEDVYKVFTTHSPQAQNAFQQTDASHYLANIYCLAKQRLNALGVKQIFGGDFCTVTEQQRFFSYRRDGITGRMASMIWIEPK